MAAARDTTVANIKPLKGAVIRRHTAGSTIVPGELVSLHSDGFVDPSDSTSAADYVTGVALPTDGALTYAAGERLDVVVFGPVVCLAGATIGVDIYNSTTPGEPLETTAGNQTSAGYSESATVLFVNPERA